jgi:serine/threonine protein kinase
MATVYRATRLLIGDTVAVKILHADQLRDAQAPERFRREAQAAARLKHQNAVTIYDFGVSDDGLVYLVMELVEGQSLRRMIKEQGPLLPSVAAEIIAQACAALDEAHRQNIVHRDIKPDNIIVATSAAGLRVKLLDFGIARLRDMSTLGNLTQTGSVMGTPHYMSPEQCLGEELDGRSDIYSLGIVLYEMLAGVVPFNSPTSMAVVVQHVSTSPAPLRVLNVSISPAVESVVMRALEKRREVRPQTAAVLAAELAAAVGGTAQVAVATSVPAGSGLMGAQTTPAFLPTVQMSTPWSTTLANPQGGGLQPGGATAPSARPDRKRLFIGVGATAAVVVVGGLSWLLFAGRESSEPAQPEQAIMDGPAQEGTTTAPPIEGEGQEVFAETLSTPEAPPEKPKASAPRPPSPQPQKGPVPGRLTIRSQPGTAILKDGAAIGTANGGGIVSVNLPPGRHLLTFRKDRYREQSQIVTVAAGVADVVQIDMVPLPGTISATANIRDATFQVDGAGQYVGQIANLELPIGRHRISASKNGYKPAAGEVDVTPGENTTITLTLEALSAADLLAEGESLYRAGNMERALSTARTVLSGNAQQPKANLLAGRALYGLRQFNDSTTYLSRAVDLGEEVTLPTKHHHAGFPSDGLCEGFVSLGRAAFAFRSTTAGGHDFSVAPSKILEVKNEPQKASRINVKVAITNGNKEEKKDYNFQNAGATLIDTGTSRVSIYHVACNGCDDSMNVLYMLLTKIRQ